MTAQPEDRLGAPTYASSGEELPLSGVVVIELCQIAAGPFCAMVLADMGADVIKIEPPGGDAMRQWPPLSSGYSENFASLNRNKRSIALNLKDPGDKDTAKRLVAAADVVLENNRPGVMERLGLGYDELSTHKPSLIYCSISAFGQTGPRATQGAFDVTMQGISGIMSVTGEEGEPPVKCGVPISDFATGLYAAFNIASALVNRQRTGRGAHIDASMLGASLGIAPLQVSEYFGTRRNPRRLGSRHPRNAPYQAFMAKDDYFVLAAGNDHLWKTVCEVADCMALLNDTRFESTAARAGNQAELKQLLEEVFASDTAQEWLRRFEAAGVPCAPINRYADVLQDPQVLAQDWIQPLTLPNGVETKTFGAPIGLSGVDFPVRRSPPVFDGDRDFILRALNADTETER
ncbi:MAG: CaiB/BaiF CoA transferase family protein [Gammaproteobacteria bacterium]